MRSDHSRPLEKDLIAVLGFVRAAKIVVQVVVFKPQPVKLAQIPRNERCIAHGPMPRAVKDGRMSICNPADQFLLSFAST